MAVIRQRISFPGIGAPRLYETYVDPRLHSAAVGAPARISAAAGADFAIFGDDKVRGTTIAVVPGELIVQRWRGTIWEPDEPDSILALMFSDGTIDLLHAGVPDHARTVIDDGWRAMYWTPWRAYFARVV